ncbi:MAG: trypsin-like peptidase domain-containing protein [Deltaproteobacteria bacterium]|nr:trypsin-like peptidase domain-containing protein [Deltaproteobacteria bacterium]
MNSIEPALLVLGAALAACSHPGPAAPRDASASLDARAQVKQPESAPANLPSFEALFERASPSVVNVAADHPLPIPADLLPEDDRQLLQVLQASSLGSGFVIDRQGHLVTCSSVIQDAQKIQVFLADGRKLPARPCAADEVSDIAVLAIDPRFAPPPLELAPPGSLHSGDWVAAFGYPFGLSHSITAGVVSAVRTADEMQSSFGRILSDAAINPGCNGGPLVDTQGRVVGINLVPAGEGESALGLAIPIDDVRGLLDQLARGQRPRHAWLGLSVQEVTEELAASFGLARAEGALVRRVLPGSPARAAGLEIGDVVVRFAGRDVTDPLAFIEQVRQAPIGKPVRIELVRRGKPRSLRITPRHEP